VLRTMPDAFVDLIYLDPPFNSNRAYNIIYPGDLGQVTAFEDTWTWTPECDRHLTDIEARTDELSRLLPALIAGIGKTQLSAYLINMAVRLVEIWRVLKATGSLYLHCDPTASHYLKIVLDAIFGRKQFRNEIVWDYSFRLMDLPHFFNRKHDILFFYAKGAAAFFAMPKEPWTREDIIRTRKQKIHRDEQGNELIWMPGGKGNSKNKLKKLSDIIQEGKAMSDVWQIPTLTSSSKERLGFPTQKPLALLDRIVRASSNPGDLILDPFCGCGTTIEAAENAGRAWVGIDMTYAAIAAIKERFKRKRIDVLNRIEIIGQPQSVADVDNSLLNQGSPLYARKEFEKFCVAVIGGVPNNKMGADGGIDGRIALAGKKQAIISVKSGKVDVRQIRELRGLLTTKQVAGVFITRQRPTQPMVEFINQAGLIQGESSGLFKGSVYPALQILTLEEILAGKQPELPYANPS